MGKKGIKCKALEKRAEENWITLSNPEKKLASKKPSQSRMGKVGRKSKTSRGRTCKKRQGMGKKRKEANRRRGGG